MKPLTFTVTVIFVVVVVFAGLILSYVVPSGEPSVKRIKVNDRSCASMFNDVIEMHHVIETDNFTNSQQNLDLLDTMNRTIHVMEDEICWKNPHHWQRYLSEPEFLDAFDFDILEEQILLNPFTETKTTSTNKVIIPNSPGLFSLFFSEDSDVISKIKSSTIENNYGIQPYEYEIEFLSTAEYCAELFDNGIADMYIQVHSIENPTYEIREFGLYHANMALLDLARSSCWDTVEDWNQLSNHQNILEKINIKQIQEETKGFEHRPAYLNENGQRVSSGGTIAVIRGNLNDFDDTKKTYGGTTWVKLLVPFNEERQIGDELMLNVSFKDLRDGDSAVQYRIPAVGFDVKIFKDQKLLSKPLSSHFTSNGSVLIPFVFQGEGEYVFLVHVTELKNSVIPKESVLISGWIH